MAAEVPPQTGTTGPRGRKAERQAPSEDRTNPRGSARDPPTDRAILDQDQDQDHQDQARPSRDVRFRLRTQLARRRSGERMAWQSPASMSANGGSSTAGDGGAVGQGQAHGTEYTLQGVMRFLQMEWHRHERDRNAWEIERAEMKTRIAKLEGENRSSKKLQDSLSNHIQLLETALKKEREKLKAMTVGGDAAKAKNSGDASRGNGSPVTGRGALSAKPSTKPHNSFLDVSPEVPSAFRDDPQRQKSRVYLEKCIQEITYLLAPPAHPPAPRHSHLAPHDMTAAHDFAGPQHPQQMLEENYLQQQRSKNLHGHQDMNMSHSSPALNHQSTSASTSAAESSILSHPLSHGQQSQHVSYNVADQSALSQPGSSSIIDNFTRKYPQPSASFPSAADVPVEKVAHSYDQYGRLISSRPDHFDLAHSRIDDRAAVDPDPWDFDEPPQPKSQEPERASEALESSQSSQPNHVPKSPPSTGLGSHRRKTSMSRRRSQEAEGSTESSLQSHMRADSANFKVRFALRGHLDVVRAVVFTGGGSPSEPEICTAGDDGVLKRWIIPASYGNYGSQGGSTHDLDVSSYFTHRGHTGVVTSLAACPSPQKFSMGGRALGDGWVFSGGQDATVRVWERGRVDPKATLVGHTDAIWSVCVLPTSPAALFAGDTAGLGGSDRILLASGAADGTVRVWAVSSPPQLSSPHSTSSRRGVGGSRRHSITSGSGFPSSPQPSIATTTPFHHTLIHTITREGIPASPTCIAPLSVTGDTFVVSYTDAAVIVFDTRTAEEVIRMASLETYDGTPATGVNCVVAATTQGGDSSLPPDSTRGLSEDETLVHGPTGSSSGVEGAVISGHEDRFIRFYDANSSQCTYTMLAHPGAISSLSLSPDGRELVSAGHDASLRFWSLEKRSCTQEITSHRLMRGEGVCSVVWSQDGRWVVSGGGDGVVKVFSR